MQLGSLLNAWQASVSGDFPVAQEFEERIRVEQVALLYRNSTIGFLVSIATGVLLVFALHGHVPSQHLAIWFGLLLVVTWLRYQLTRQYEKSSLAKRSRMAWENLFLAGTAAAGLVWGMTILVLFPADSLAYQFCIALVLSGLVGGSVAVFAARKTSSCVFSTRTTAYTMSWP